MTARAAGRASSLLPGCAFPLGCPVSPGAVRPRRALCAAALLASPLAAQPLPVAASAWRVEAEDPRARVRFYRGTIDIDTPQGVTLWYARPLDGPLAIAFEAMAVSTGGANDRVSDLNAFWMATDPAAPGGSPLGRRSGRFEDYDTLRTYYVGIGGNGNTSTRMRRYVARAGERPLLPEHDLGGPALVANRWTRVRLIANGARTAVERDGRALFAMTDTAPYTRGWFALRTTQSHLRIRNLSITTLRHARHPS